MASTDSASPAPAGFCGTEGRPVTESMGEALLGHLLDRAHLIPPDRIGPLVAQEARAAGVREVAVLLQDYDQAHLRPLTGRGLSGEWAPIAGSPAGQAFAESRLVEEVCADGSVRLHVPMLDGADRIGVLSLRLPRVNDVDRQLARRLTGLVADMIVTKNKYTDVFDRVRAARPLSLAAQLQRSNLPPLSMATPSVDLAGVLEPAYEVGGDAFDYALNGHLLHVGVFDAMGHGLAAAAMSTVVLATYRHGRRDDAALPDLFAAMDEIVTASFPGQFATAGLGELDVSSGELRWITAGHPRPLWVRDAQVLGELGGQVSRPLGLGGRPVVESIKLEPGDRVLLSGTIGEHGTAIMLARGEFDLDADIESDTRALWPEVDALLDAAGPHLRCLRDATRGGVASVLNELARAAGVALLVREAAVPVQPAVAGASELLGIDPMYVACEGRMVVVVPGDSADRAIAALRGHPLGEGAAVIGHVTDGQPGIVQLKTAFGGTRIVDLLVGDPLPRIC